MKTLEHKNNVGTVKTVDILARLNSIEEEKQILEQALRILGGVNKVRAIESKPVIKPHTSHASPHRGSPDEVFAIAKQINGDFTMKSLLVEVRKNKVRLDKTQVMNAIQALVKRNQVNIKKSGKGRAVAVYEVNPGYKEADKSTSAK